MLTVKSTINIAGQTVPQIIPVVQGDTGRAILFTLADFTIPQDATATYYIQKPSGEAVYNVATIDGNTVLVELTAQSIIEAGDNYGQVRIESDGEIVTSFDFILLVKPFRGIDAVESTTEMNIFDKAVEQAEEAIDEAKVEALEEIAQAGSGNIAEEFDAANSYLAGEYTIYEAKLYRFTSNHTGLWTGSDAEEVTVGDELTDINEELTEINEDLTDVKSDLTDITGPNKNLLYFYPFATNGASVDFVGDNIIVTATSASTYRNGYCDIPVNGHNSMTLSYNSKSSDSQGVNAASIRVGFINSQGTNTWQGYVSSSPGTYNVAGVVKVRIGLYVDQATVEIGTKSTFNKIQVEYGETATAFSKAKYDAYDRALTEEVKTIKTNLPNIVSDVIAEIGLNKYNPNTKVVGYISNNTGNINENADYFTSDYIDVSAFTKGYAFTPKARKILFYDANKNAISASYYTDETAAGVIALNSAYKYIRLSWYKTSTDVMVCDATTLPPYVPYEIVAKDGINYLNSETTTKVRQMVGDGGKSSQIGSFLNGKTVLVFGDSIMYGAGNDGDGIADLLADKYGMVAADYSVSGATMGVRTDDPQYTVDEAHHIAKQVRNAIAADVSPDLIILDGGTNDIGGEIPIGTMSDVYTQPVSENNFADGFETVAYLLMKNFIGVPIIYMRAHNMSSRTYTGQISYGELGNQIAEKWGIRTVDMYKRMNTQLAEYRTAYLADYTHPNEAGYEKYYIPAIEDFVFSELVN